MKSLISKIGRSITDSGISKHMKSISIGAMIFATSLGLQNKTQAQAIDSNYNTNWQYTTPLLQGLTAPGVAVGGDGLIYVMGGSVGDATGKVQKFNEETKEWNYAPSLPLPIMNNSGASDNQGRVYSIAGSRYNEGTLNFLNNVYRYDPSMQLWEEVTPLNHSRVGHCSVTGSQGDIYVFGGHSGNVMVPSLEVYDVETNTWNDSTPMLTPRSRVAGAIDSQDRIFAMGGFDTNRNWNKVEMFDIKNPELGWQIKNPIYIEGMMYGTTGIDGQIYINKGTRIEIYDPFLDVSETHSFLNQKRDAAPGFIMGKSGNIYAIAGIGGVYDTSVEFIEPIIPPTFPVNAMIDISPEIINLNKVARNLETQITITDKGYTTNDIDWKQGISITKITGSSSYVDYLQTSNRKPTSGDRDGNCLPDLTVKFNGQDISSSLWPGLLKIEIQGFLNDGSSFVGYGDLNVTDAPCQSIR